MLDPVEQTTKEAYKTSGFQPANSKTAKFQNDQETLESLQEESVNDSVIEKFETHDPDEKSKLLIILD